MNQMEYDKIKAYAIKNDLTLSSACEALNADPRHFYAFTARAKRMALPTLTRKRSGPRLGAKRGPRMQTVVVEAPAVGSKITALIGPRAEVIEALKALL